MSFTSLVPAGRERLASVTGQRPIRVDFIRGMNPAIGSSDAVISRVGTISAYITTAGAFEVLSSSANNAAAGTGARTIQVKGLDASWNEFTETVTLNGVTPVPLVNSSVFRINSAKVLTAGSGLKNAGNIDIRTVTGSTVYKSIPSVAQAVGQDFDFLYTVPAGMIGVVTDLWISYYRIAGATAGSMHFYIMNTNSAGVTNVGWGAGIINSPTANTSGGGHIDRTNLMLPVASKETIDLRGFCEAAPSSNTPVRAHATIMLFKDGFPY
jgi:hypothetical protein